MGPSHSDTLKNTSVLGTNTERVITQMHVMYKEASQTHSWVCHDRTVLNKDIDAWVDSLLHMTGMVGATHNRKPTPNPHPTRGANRRPNMLCYAFLVVVAPQVTPKSSRHCDTLHIATRRTNHTLARYSGAILATAQL